MDQIMDGIRWILWMLCKTCFFFIDGIYNIIKPILTFDIGANTTMWKWWAILCALIGFFTFIRMFTMFLKAGVDEDYAMKLNPMNAITRLIAIAVVLSLMPITLKYFTSLSTAFMSNASQMFKVTENFANNIIKTGNAEKDKKLKEIYEQYDGMPSQIFIAASSEGKYPPYPLIDINTTEGGLDNLVGGIPIIGGVLDFASGVFGMDGSYVYYRDTTQLIILIVEAVCGAYLFILMAMQISQRIVSIGIKILMSPIPISGIINPDDRSFGLWIKLLSADLISNFLQYLILLFVMMLTSSKAVQNFGILGQTIFFLGGLLAVLVGPGQVAQLIGGDGMGLFQTMQGFQAISTLKGLTKAGGSAAAGLIGGGAALGIYGAGRASGLHSLGNGAKGSPVGGPGAGPGMNYGSDNPDGGGGMGPSGNGQGGNTGSIPPKAFSEPATEKQIKTAQEKYGLDVSNMSKGEASLALDKEGFGKSYWHDATNTKGFDGFTGSTAKGTIDSGNKTYGFDNAGASTSGYYEDAEGAHAGYAIDDGYDNSGIDSDGGTAEGTGSSGNATKEPPRLSRENTFARRVADNPNMGVRAASKAARSMYFASGNRLMGQKTVVRGGRYISKNTKAQSLSNLRAGISDLRNPAVNEKDLSGTSRRDDKDLRDLNRFEEEDL